MIHEIKCDNLIRQDFQYIFRCESSVLESMQGMIFVRVYCVLLVQVCHK